MSQPTARSWCQEEMARRSVVIFQNFYAEGQQDWLDPDFVPHDGRANANTHYREIGLFIRLYHSDRYKAGEYTGIVSPKFGHKTRLKGGDFIKFVNLNPGFDVYFVNPYPCNAYYSYNVWEHGELCHPGLIPLAQDLFDRAGIDAEPANFGRNAHSTLLYCNYWVGNERFWHYFMEYNMRLINVVERLSKEARERLFARDPEYPDPVPFLPFIFERLFSTFLLLEPSIRALAYPHNRDYIIRSGEGTLDEPILVRSFVDVIDEIDRRGQYTRQDRAIFDAVARLKRNLKQGPARLIPR